MGVYGYCRVSTSRQATEGESLEVQERTLNGYAQMHGLKFDKIFIERGVSGAKPLRERPQGAALLAVIKAGDIIIAPKLDRMFRSALDGLAMLEFCEQARVGLHLIDLGGDVTSSISRLMFTILSAVAEAERNRIKERVQEMKNDQKARGKFLGGRMPFGWAKDDNGVLVKNPVELEALRRMKRYAARGDSLRRIAKVMTAEGFKISHAGVKKILERKDANIAYN